MIFSFQPDSSKVIKPKDTKSEIPHKKGSFQVQMKG